MPGSVAETLYGRRGGGWAPAPAPAPAPAREPVEPKSKTDPMCSCGRSYSAHSGDLCPVCRRPVEHHGPGELDAEWAGRARMARARAAALDDTGHHGTVNGAGILAPLDAVDLEALERARVAA